MTDKIKQGDLRPRWEATLYDGDVALDLSTASTVKVIFQKPDGNVVTRTVTGGSDGVVAMDWQPGDTDQLGKMLFEVEVTWPVAKPQTFPVDDYLATTVYQDLG